MIYHELLSFTVSDSREGLGNSWEKEVTLPVLHHRFLLQAIRDKTEIKYVDPVISSRTIKHSSFTNLLTWKSCKEDWQLLYP
ncbi:hypothetical protein AV530_015975 [Patagioenas fasciata monilis]|uniref:Uncharacterized protein n=1 Tax=Patagioenas fasciata monilis TaxID=372326 RepID=A0A1V4KJQ6_PATFA|nr:hypothetical protein AV530_015975 [Patagioenas fasciata monilis]